MVRKFVEILFISTVEVAHRIFSSLILPQLPSHNSDLVHLINYFEAPATPPTGKSEHQHRRYSLRVRGSRRIPQEQCVIFRFSSKPPPSPRLLASTLVPFFPSIRRSCKLAARTLFFVCVVGLFNSFRRSFEWKLGRKSCGKIGGESSVVGVDCSSSFRFFFPPSKFVFQLVISIYLFIYLYFFFLVCDGFFAFSDSSPLFEIMMVSSRRTNGSCAAFARMSMCRGYGCGWWCAHRLRNGKQACPFFCRRVCRLNFNKALRVYIELVPLRQIRRN